MTRDRAHFLLLNIGHFLDHLFSLIFATVAALALTREWGLGYADLLKYATPGFFAFGLFSLPAGWLADKWSRDGMMSVFFIGIGLASIATSFAQTPLQVGMGLFAIGIFAAIYHPVGLAIVTARWKNTGMRISINGVWGNLGVASAALITGYMIDNGGWRMAFVLPGVVSIVIGIVYAGLRWQDFGVKEVTSKSTGTGTSAALTPDYKALLMRLSAIVFLTTAFSSIIFQSTTFALPKIFDERLQGLSASVVDWLQFMDLPGRTDIATMVVFLPSLFSRSPPSLSSSSVDYWIDMVRVRSSWGLRRCRSSFSRPCRACTMVWRLRLRSASCWARSDKFRSTTS